MSSRLSLSVGAILSPTCAEKPGCFQARSFFTQLGRDGMGKDEPRQQALPEEAHQQGGVPLRQGLPGAARRLAAVGREQVEVRMPLDQVASAGDRDDDARSGVVAEAPADELADGLGGGPPAARWGARAGGARAVGAAAGWSGRRADARPWRAPPRTATRPTGAAVSSRMTGKTTCRGKRRPPARFSGTLGTTTGRSHARANRSARTPVAHVPPPGAAARAAGRSGSARLAAAPPDAARDELEQRRVTEGPLLVDPGN